MKQNILKILKKMIVGLFLIITFTIMFYPINNQSITMVIDTDGVDATKVFSPDQLDDVEEFRVDYSDAEDYRVREIRFYRKFKSVCVDKIRSTDLSNYGIVDENGYLFNKNACELMQGLTKSAMIERLIYIECALAVTLLLWIIINALQEKLDSNNYSNHGPMYEIKKFLGDIKKYWQYMNYAAKADLKAEVANSYLNRLWWLLEPFFNMLVYVIVFGRVMGNSIENYATFVFSALLMWNYFNKTINYSVRLVRSNRDIITKVYVPKHVLLISHMIMELLVLLRQ